MATEFLDYPKGRVAMDGGELQDCYDASLSYDDGETPVHTFRNKGEAAGSTGGKRLCTLAFSSAISEDGFERDYMGKWRKREVVSVRFKAPGHTETVVGRLTKPSIKSNVDGFIDFSVSVAGKSSGS